jgi:hypothetical protein
MPIAPCGANTTALAAMGGYSGGGRGNAVATPALSRWLDDAESDRERKPVRRLAPSAVDLVQLAT